MLNFNAASEDMVFNQNGQMLALAEPTLSQWIPYFSWTGSLSCTIKKFLEVLHQDGYSLFAQYKCRVIPRGNLPAMGERHRHSSTRSYSSLSSGGRVYELKLLTIFQVKPYTIYFLDNGCSEVEKR